MGDDGKLYLPAEMVPLYRSTIVPLASIMSPNQFEAEQLTETTIQTQQDALQACNTLLQRGPQTVVRCHPPYILVKLQSPWDRNGQKE